TIVLPSWKFQQTTSYSGPIVPYIGGNTSLSGYYIPPVAAHSKVSISFYNFIPGSIDISIFPTQLGNIAPAGEPVYYGTLLTNATYTFNSADSVPYGLYVISYNHTAYTLKIAATSSPYFWLTTYTSVGVMATFASGVLLYYYSFTSRRWKAEEEAIREARRAPPPRSGG
ncbi:MAG TPA: hypothetical protein VFE91_00485, partial [Nitrososphaerales archaeon]|nr:hypothetical protein [Nitrososphaerales archaeon]